MKNQGVEDLVLQISDAALLPSSSSIFLFFSVSSLIVLIWQWPIGVFVCHMFDSVNPETERKRKMEDDDEEYENGQLEAWNTGMNERKRMREEEKKIGKELQYRPNSD